jgi:hypothetical protein
MVHELVISLIERTLSALLYEAAYTQQPCKFFNAHKNPAPDMNTRCITFFTTNYSRGL